MSSSGRQISSPVGELQQTHPALGQHAGPGHIGPWQSCLIISCSSITSFKVITPIKGLAIEIVATVKIRRMIDFILVTELFLGPTQDYQTVIFII